MTKKYYSNGTTKFYNDYFKSLDAKRYGQVRNNFTDSEDAFNYIGYQMGGWIIRKCSEKVNIDYSVEDYIELTFSEIGKFTKRERDDEGYFIDRGRESGRVDSVMAYLRYMIPRRLCNLNNLSEADRKIAGQIRELWNKYYDITNEEIADMLDVPLTDVNMVSELMKGNISLDYKNDESDDLSLYESTPYYEEGYRRIECQEILSDLAKEISELQLKVIKKHGGGVVERETLRQMLMEKEYGTSSKNKMILQQLNELGYDTNNMNSTTISNIRIKIENWLDKDKDYQESLDKLKEIFKKYIDK